MNLSPDYTLAFDPEIHRYVLNGKPVPSVTQVLVQRNMYPGREWWTDADRLRGTAVHAATEFWDQNDLDESTVLPEIAPYLEAWKRFRADTGCEIKVIEERYASVKLGFAGTIDRIIEIDGKQILLDIKSGAWMAAYLLQIAAYKRLCDEHGFPIYQAIALSLHKDGTYTAKTLSHLDLMQGDRMFLAALSLTNYLRDWR